MNIRRHISLLLWTSLLVALLVFSGASQAQTPPFTRNIARFGFGDHHNDYAWSMAWFKGKLYVGTSRSELCVEAATIDFYNPGYYRSPPDGFPEADCPPDKYAMDLRAEIWQYTPETGTWKRVYQSPDDIPNPREPGKFVARDIGFRGMVVYREPNGQRALYVGGLTADEYIPELAEAYPPRILRSVDGETFTPLPGAPGLIHNTFGAQRPIGFRAMTVYKGRLYVTASGGLAGDGVILEVKDPSGSAPEFVQVSPDTMQIFEMEPFNGTLYAGAGDAKAGYSVWKLVDEERTPFRFKPIVTDGAGRGSGITSVVSMHVFKGRLYVGSSGWGVFPSSELIRVNPDDSWELVSGNPRFAPDGSFKFPISGLPDGLGNFFTAHIWRQETHQGALYVGTNDWSWGLRNIPLLGTLLAPEYGFDVYGTCDGRFWWTVTRDGFGDGRYNFGARTIVSTPTGAFLGTANHIEGTSVWQSTDPSPCGEPSLIRNRTRTVGSGTVPRATRLKAPRRPFLRPGRLLAEVRPCGTVLSWDRRRSAARYRILRARYLTADVNVTVPPKLPGGFFAPDLPPTAASPGSGSTRGGQVSIAGSYALIGTTTKGYFVDRDAGPGAPYTYEVVAEGTSGQASPPSNIATAPSELPDVSFDRLSAAVRRLPAGGTASLRRLATAAGKSWQHGDRAGSLRTLARIRSTVTASAAHAARTHDTAQMDDLQDAVLRLERHVRLPVRCR